MITLEHNIQDKIGGLLRAPIPAQTESYSPVPHAEFLSKLTNKLGELNYHVIDRRIYANNSNTQVIGFYDVIKQENVENKENLEFAMSIGFKNSYDKTMSAAIVMGASVMICKNGMISGDLIAFKRKHTGSILVELDEKINTGVNKMNDSFQILISDANIMKSYSLSDRQKAEILGIMYFEKEIVTPTQLSIVKNELKESKTFRGNTVWDLYNHVTVALKKSHPLRYVEDHIKLHSFMTEDIVGIQREIIDVTEQENE